MIETTGNKEKAMSILRKAEDREQQLLTLLRCHRRLETAAVTRELGISEATGRRLFARLETEGKVLRVHGGIQLPEETPGYSFDRSQLEYEREKFLIGEYAASLVKSGDDIFLDAGTTVRRVAESLITRLKADDLHQVTIITNSLALPNELSRYCEVILIGGTIRPERRDVSGALARYTLARFNFSKVFFGVDAISPAGELMTTDTETVEINQLFLKQSAASYVLADAAKFERTSLISFGRLNDVTGVITTLSPARLPARLAQYRPLLITVGHPETRAERAVNE